MMKRKLLSVLLVTVMLLTMIPLGAVSVSAATYGGLTYEIVNGEAIITGCDGDSAGVVEIVIPETIEGYPVTIIDEHAFYGYEELIWITIPDSVTYIRDYAFKNCKSLFSVTIPDSVISIGWSAFENCYNLTSITIPDSVNWIGYMAFCECTRLTNVYISDVAEWCDITFQSAPSNPLRYASKLYLNGELVRDLVIPDGVTRIRELAFSSCDCLTSVTIPDSVTRIDVSAFSVCINLTDVYYAGTEEQASPLKRYTGNDPLYNATWHYGTINPKYHFSTEVTHSAMDTENGYGLAFRFELAAKGVVKDSRNVMDLSGATIEYLGTECKLIGMGAIATNSDADAENLTLDTVNGDNVVNIPTVYLQETDEDSCAFATRIIQIPGTQLERTIYVRPYYVVEVDGEQIVVYGNTDSASCAEYL